MGHLRQISRLQMEKVKYHLLLSNLLHLELLIWSERVDNPLPLVRLQQTDVSTHHHNIETLKHDLSNCEKLMETYKEQCESVTDKLRQEQSKHREIRDSFIMSEEAHRQELAAQKKLTSMFKAAEEKATTEIQELVKTTAEYKECFDQLTQGSQKVF